AENAIGVSFFQDEDYPRHLSHCADAPVLLFKKGAVDLGHSPVISVVGTRKMTHYGKSFCENLLADIRDFNPVIVSGFAYGVDICAHRAALDNGLQTVAVLAHGFEELYPKSHRKYQQSILSNGGFLTDFWHTDGLDRVHFLRRNRIIAGLSEATVIIESAEKGGALVTADIADSYHRDVFALPGRSNDPFSRGCNNLIKQHKAAMLTSATDLIELLGWDLRQTRKETGSKKPVAPLDKQEQPLYDFLRESGKESLDHIALRCNLSVHQTSALLFGLEMKGAVRTLPGKIYEVT
ncbi:MAG: DNA-processing protein DprA, partial [Lutibacter sp.]|nr:DNA-processing protein DprA [Lutibacter sp.]